MAAVLGKPGSISDWEAIREICCLTADRGLAAAPERWPFFSEYWIGPYRDLLPDWTYVAREGPDVAGYLTGCPDTRTFQGRRLLRHRVPLLVRVIAGRYADSCETRRFVARALRLEPHPEECLGAATMREAQARFPAHLHVNVAPRFQGRGLGLLLARRFLADLAGAGVAGVHLVCGDGPVGFYDKLGFETLAAGRTRTGTALHLLAMRLGA